MTPRDSPSNPTTGRLARFQAAFGPGLLWAAAAVGVSHLVQSTRAGAIAGLGLVGVVIGALILKYPFFEFGPRYAAATGESLLEGYGRIGRWALWLYFGITLGTAVIVQSVIVLLTAFLANYALGLSWPVPLTAAVTMAAVAAILAVGRYRALDGTIKLLMALLALSTLTAAVVVAPRLDFGSLRLFSAPPADIAPFAFVLALVGWMPSAIDISVWSSLWTLAKAEGRPARPSVEEVGLDFRIGYFGTSILALAFVSLGAGVMFTSGRTFSPSGASFSTELVELYTETLGGWTRPIVLVAVVTTMLSTALTVIDGFPRAIERAIHNLGPSRDAPAPVGRRPYWISIAVLFVATEVVLLRFLGNLTTLVDFATIVSFLTAPVLGYLNLRVVTGEQMPVEHRPGPALRGLSWLGLLALGGIGLVFVFTVFTR